MILGFKRDLAHKRRTRARQAQLAKLPRVVAGENVTPRRRLEYESIHPFDWDGSRLTESFRDPNVLLHEKPYVWQLPPSDEPFAGGSGRRQS
jgi:hypothetical protein